MKGYRMVLLVNGGLLLFVALSALLLGNVLDRQAQDCESQDPVPRSCDQTRDAATTANSVAPILAAVGVLLLGLGAFLGRTTDDVHPPKL
jgi:hypothetical protein